MSSFPNNDPKIVGDVVETVHPCNVGRYPLGTVEAAHEINGTAYVSVRLGPGSTVYGPAENWRVAS